MKTEFYDRHDRIDYLKACEMARRIVANPELIGQLLRQTRPIFGRGFTSQEVRRLMEQAGLLPPLGAGARGEAKAQR